MTLEGSLNLAWVSETCLIDEERVIGQSGENGMSLITATRKTAQRTKERKSTVSK